ncbi:MAG: DUF427 domain-containing protein [Kiloniellaceae bacterium]
MTGATNPSETSERITIEPCAKRVRAVFNGQTVAESEHALVMHEAGYPPRAYFPQADVRMDLLRRTAHTTHCPYKGDAAYWTLAVDGETLENAAWAYLEPLPGVAEIAGRLSFIDAVRVELQSGS